MIAIIHASKLQSALPPGVLIPHDRLFVCHADDHGCMIITGLSQYLPQIESREVKPPRMRRGNPIKGTHGRTAWQGGRELSGRTLVRTSVRPACSG
jgi:hypothetical protein